MEKQVVMCVAMGSGAAHCELHLPTTLLFHVARHTKQLQPLVCLATSTDCLATPLDCLSMSTPPSHVDRTWDHLLLQFGLARRERMEISQSYAGSAGPTTQPAVYTVSTHHPASCVHSVHPPTTAVYSVHPPSTAMYTVSIHPTLLCTQCPSTQLAVYTVPLHPANCVHSAHPSPSQLCTQCPPIHPASCVHSAPPSPSQLCTPVSYTHLTLPTNHRV